MEEQRHQCRKKASPSPPLGRNTSFQLTVDENEKGKPVTMKFSASTILTHLIFCTQTSLLPYYPKLHPGLISPALPWAPGKRASGQDSEMPAPPILAGGPARLCSCVLHFSP